MNKKNLESRIRSVNARILNTEKRYGKDSQIVQRIYSTINKIYGTEGKTRYSIPKGELSLRELNKIERGVALVEESRYTSKAGREYLRNASMKSFANNNMHSKFTDVEIEKLYDMFEHNTDWQKLREIAGSGFSELTLDAISRAIHSDSDDKSPSELVNDYFDYSRSASNPDDFVTWVNNNIWSR